MRAVRADGPACALSSAIPDVHTEAPVNSYAFPIASRREPANRVVGARRAPTRLGHVRIRPLARRSICQGVRTFTFACPMCGRSADGTLSIGVVRLLRIVIVFDAADLNAASAFLRTRHGIALSTPLGCGGSACGWTESCTYGFAAN